MKEPQPQRPQYRFRVFLLASLGYAYLLFIVALLLGIIAVTIFYIGFNILMLKVLWIPLVLAGLVVRSLWVTIPEPDGTELKREQAPALFELIDDVNKVLSGPKVHHVLISDEFDASIVQIPLFGMFGWQRNYLVIGLPLMVALTPAEFRAVLAYEFGCLSEKHGRFSAWIYRVRQTWDQLLTTVRHERNYASFLFAPFLEWYAPRLLAHSFLLARAQEREADSYAVDVAGRHVTASTLTQIGVKRRALDEDFWPAFFNGAKEQALTPRDPFTQMLTGLSQPVSRAKARRWILEALRTPAAYEGSIALAERLEAIGFDPDGTDLTRLVDAVVKADEVKATRYLPELPEEFLASMNRLWRERVAHTWNERHSEIKKARKRLAELDERGGSRPLTIDEQWERATALADARERSAALPALKALLEEAPHHVSGNFAMGQILLEEGDADGVAYLEKTMQSGADTAAQACQLISDFYLEQGYEEIAETFRQHAVKYFHKAGQLQQQAINICATDEFAPHDFDDVRIAQLQFQLRKVRGLRSAFLFRKIIGSNEAPLYVLGVTAEYTWREGESGKHLDLLFEELQAKVVSPLPVTLLALEGEHAHLLTRVRQIPGAEIVTPRAEI